MALYEYFCASNGRTVEVRHPMSEMLRTWGELCRQAGLKPGDTPPDVPVERRVSAPIPLTGRPDRPSADSGPAPCGPSCACAWD